MHDLKEMLEKIFPGSKVEVDDDGDEIRAVVTGINGLECWYMDDIEETYEYQILVWMFDCKNGGQLILHLVKVGDIS